MIAIDGIYEIAVRVRDLARAEAFYQGVLGLKSGLRDDRRNWHFLWTGDNAGMVVLQEDAAEWPSQHFAFRVAPPEIERAARVLSDHGVATQGPVRHDWMGGCSLYFTDPDGHQLELFALGLPD